MTVNLQEIDYPFRPEIIFPAVDRFITWTSSVGGKPTLQLAREYFSGLSIFPQEQYIAEYYLGSDKIVPDHHWDIGGRVRLMKWLAARLFEVDYFLNSNRPEIGKLYGALFQSADELTEAFAWRQKVVANGLSDPDYPLSTEWTNKDRFVVVRSLLPAISSHLYLLRDGREEVFLIEALAYEDSVTLEGRRDAVVKFIDDSRQLWQTLYKSAFFLIN